jgi:hypothetical protein
MFANAFFGGFIGAIVGVLLIAVVAFFIVGDDD